MSGRVVIVGAGIAGLAAVRAAAAHGLDLRLFDPSLGASCLWGGAVDDRPWEQVARASDVLGASALAGPVPPEVARFIESLGIWELAPAGRPLVRLATEAGRVRVSRGRDRAVLDLSALPTGARVVLPLVPRGEWDADSLARALSADGYARGRSLTFAAAEAKLLRYVGEERIAEADMAIRHDEPERRRWLTERLQEMLARERDADRQVDAILMGPWLGAERPRAEELSAALGVNVGEVLSNVGNAAGMRFEAARDRLLASMGIERELERVRAVRRSADGLLLQIEGRRSPIEADRVVLAIGGLVGGGLRYTPPERAQGDEDPPPARVPFALSVDAPVHLRAQSRSLDIVSSTHGPSLDELGWPSDPDQGLLEAVGVACEGPLAAPGIYVAGDTIADRPRTRLQAVYSGLRAGAAAAAAEP